MSSTSTSPTKQPKRSLTSLASAATAQQLDRIICASCIGYGGDKESADCLWCKEAITGFCSTHRCRVCHGAGVVCPRCKGMRWLASGHSGQMSTAKPYSTTVGDKQIQGKSMINNGLVICEMCTEGNQVNPLKEVTAIKAYIADNQTPEWQARQRADEKRRAWEKKNRFISKLMRQNRKQWWGKGGAVYDEALAVAIAAYEEQEVHAA